MNKIKKFLSALTSVICIGSVCTASVNACIGCIWDVEREEVYKYEEYLSYKIVDVMKFGDYKSSYVTITDCCETATSIEIPDEIDGLPVEKISDKAFENCTELKNIVIPDTVKKIEYNAFWSSGIESIAISNNVNSYIDEFTFYHCTNLKEVIIGDYITDIAKYAFCECESLEKITIGKNVYGVGNSSFQDCDKLKEITMPENIQNIGNSAFRYCDNLEKVTVENPLASIYNSETVMPEYTAIAGYENSTAHIYAEKYNREFISLGESPVPIVYEGDANMDYRVNVRDCAYIAAMISGGKKNELSQNADYNLDHDINIRDAAGIARRIINSEYINTRCS